MLGKDFEAHSQAAQGIYGKNCLFGVFFGEDDTGLKQMKDFYASRKSKLGSFPMKGRIDYRLEGQSRTIRQPLDVEFLVMPLEDCQKSDKQ